MNVKQKILPIQAENKHYENEVNIMLCHFSITPLTPINPCEVHTHTRVFIRRRLTTRIQYVDKNGGRRVILRFIDFFVNKHRFSCALH